MRFVYLAGAALGLVMASQVAAQGQVVSGRVGGSVSGQVVPLNVDANGKLQVGGITGGSGGGAAQGIVVSGDQSYTVGSNQTLNMTATGRLKVGVSSASNITPAAIASTTLAADLVGCTYRTPVAWSAGWTGALQCDANGNVTISDAVEGTIADTAYAGSGNATVISGLKGLYAAQNNTNNGISVLGTSADTAYSGSGSASINSVLKGIYAADTAPIPTGSNVIGFVKQADNLTVPITSLSASGVVFSMDTTGYQSLVYQPGGTWAGTVAFQGSNDNSNFQTNIAYSGFSGNAITSTTNNTLVCIPVTSRYLRGNFTFTSGTITGTAWLRGTPCPSALVSSVAVTSQPGLSGGTNFVGQFGQAANAGTVGSTVATSATSSTSGKTSAGNIYGVNVVNNTTAGYVLALNLAAAPTASAAITPASVLWAMPLAAGGGIFQGFNVPITASTGIQVIFSTSMTTYTVPATLPYALSVYYK